MIRELPVMGCRYISGCYCEKRLRQVRGSDMKHVKNLLETAEDQRPSVCYIYVPVHAGPEKPF